jgi:hypothetical protein
MPISYSYDAPRGMILARVTGPTTLADIEEYFRTVRREPWFPAPALTDVRGSTAAMSNDEVRSAVNRLRELASSLRGMPIAIVTDSPASFGLSRMVEQLLDDAVHIHVFRDEPSALAWLHGAGGTPSADADG